MPSDENNCSPLKGGQLTSVLDVSPYVYATNKTPPRPAAIRITL